TLPGPLTAAPETALTAAPETVAPVAASVAPPVLKQPPWLKALDVKGPIAPCPISVRVVEIKEGRRLWLLEPPVLEPVPSPPRIALPTLKHSKPGSASPLVFEPGPSPPRTVTITTARGGPARGGLRPGGVGCDGAVQPGAPERGVASSAETAMKTELASPWRKWAERYWECLKENAYRTLRRSTVRLVSAGRLYTPSLCWPTQLSLNCEVFESEYAAYRALHALLTEVEWRRLSDVKEKAFATCNPRYVELAAVIGMFYDDPFGSVTTRVKELAADYANVRSDERLARRWSRARLNAWINGCLLQCARVPEERLKQFCLRTLLYKPAANRLIYQCYSRYSVSAEQYWERSAQKSDELFSAMLNALPPIQSPEGQMSAAEYARMSNDRRQHVVYSWRTGFAFTTTRPSRVRASGGALDLRLFRGPIASSRRSPPPLDLTAIAQAVARDLRLNEETTPLLDEEPAPPLDEEPAPPLDEEPAPPLDEEPAPRLDVVDHMDTDRVDTDRMDTDLDAESLETDLASDRMETDSDFLDSDFGHSNSECRDADTESTDSDTWRRNSPAASVWWLESDGRGPWAATVGRQRRYSKPQTDAATFPWTRGKNGSERLARARACLAAILRGSEIPPPVSAMYDMATLPGRAGVFPMDTVGDEFRKKWTVPKQRVSKGKGTVGMETGTVLTETMERDRSVAAYWDMTAHLLQAMDLTSSELAEFMLEHWDWPRIEHAIMPRLRGPPLQAHCAARPRTFQQLILQRVLETANLPPTGEHVVSAGPLLCKKRTDRSLLLAFECRPDLPSNNHHTPLVD
ncbi:hypothetical protein GNI_072280, partial [Gregarina niphandrodes]